MRALITGRSSNHPWGLTVANMNGWHLQLESYVVDEATTPRPHSMVMTWIIIHEDQKQLWQKDDTSDEKAASTHESSGLRAQDRGEGH